MEIIASDVVDQRVNMLTPSSYDGAVANKRVVTMPANIMCITVQTSR